MTVGSRESGVGSHQSGVGSRVPSHGRTTGDSGLSTTDSRPPTTDSGLPTTDDRLPTAAHARRVIVEHVRPAIDGGRFAIKRTVGERVDVSADIFADGHDVVAAVL